MDEAMISRMMNLRMHEMRHVRGCARMRMHGVRTFDAQQEGALIKGRVLGQPTAEATEQVLGPEAAERHALQRLVRPLRELGRHRALAAALAAGYGHLEGRRRRRRLAHPVFR